MNLKQKTKRVSAIRNSFYKKKFTFRKLINEIMLSIDEIGFNNTATFIAYQKVQN